MPVQLQSRMDYAQWAKATSEWSRIIQKAEKGAIHDVGIKARDDVRAMVGAAGFGSKWQKSFVARFGFNEGSLYNPFALIHSTINYAGVFETGKVETRNYIWLPLPQVPPIAGRPHMTPSQYYQNVGPLVFMRTPGKPPMLGRTVRVPRGGGRPFLTVASQRRGLSRKPRSDDIIQTIPMFVGVSSVNIPTKWDVKGTVENAAKGLSEAYEANLEKYDGGT
jgi:hypothetical protein